MGLTAFKSDLGYSVRDHPHELSRDLVDARQEPRGTFRHHHDALTVRRQTSDQVPGQRGRLCHQRVERRDQGLATSTHEVQDTDAPLTGIEAELVLQAHHIARTVVGHFRGQAVGGLAAVVDDVDNPRVFVTTRIASC